MAADLGADPLTPNLHAFAERQRTDLTALIDGINVDPSITLTEPTDDFVATLAACAWCGRPWSLWGRRVGRGWSGWADSNRRPHGPKPRALPD